MFDESKHPRDDDGKFTSSDGAGGTHEATEAEKQRLRERGIRDGGGETKKLTPAEKIASVHIDFTKDNILPELNDDTLMKLGEKNSKSVLLKASLIKRNLGKHLDVSEKVMQEIIAEALYNPIDVFPANPDKPNYYHMASFVEIPGKDGLKMGLVLLDIDKSKEHFEIGHAYFVDGDGFEKAKNKTQKKD